ncbi:MAG: exosortase/archaeosortase family protein [candidate division Zixibacteria bacterium]|nr:exosortase/archaeosortase family protein [candidate division Zixibacteria bacterium]
MTTTTHIIPKDRPAYIAFGLLVLFYLPAIYDLVIDWYTDPNYSHGFLVPIISAYLLWKKRTELVSLPQSGNNAGLIVIILGMILFVLGNGASEYFTVRFSLVVMIFGLVLYLCGTPLVRRTWFEILFLVFMIPIPYVIYFSATFPMQLFASKVTVTLLSLLGMPVIRQGNIIHLPNQMLEVAEACSGLRSLISLLALGALYAYMTQRQLSGKIILFLSTIPIAIIGNVFRVFVTALLAYTLETSVTTEPIHTIMGLSVFVVAFVLLFVFGAILRWILR